MASVTGVSFATIRSSKSLYLGALVHRSSTSVRVRRPRRLNSPRWRSALAAVVIAAGTLLTAPVVASAATTATPDQWTGNYGSSASTSADPGEHAITAATAGKVRPAFTVPGRSVTPYPPVILGGVVYSVAGTAPKLTASSPKTGKTLWTMTLPYTANAYGFGMTGTGSTVLISFGEGNTGGVLAVNVVKHTVAWRGFLPKSTIAGTDGNFPGAPTTDGTRVYLDGSSNTVNAFAVATGAFLWAHPYTSNGNGGLDGVDGVAAGGGYLYTSGGQGLVAYNAATGKKVWTSYPAYSAGTPVLAGGRVFVNTGDQIDAFPAAGCGSTTCRPTWKTTVNSYDYDYIEIAGADASSVFLSYRTSRSTPPTDCQSAFIGNVSRLSATTGKVQWHVAVGDYTQSLIRGSNVIWLLNEFTTSKCEDSYRILGYSTAATTSTPAAAIVLPTDYYGFPQTLAVASGTLFETVNQRTIVGYRVPGT
jgi:outer membrane protein assembly factor BamB